MRGGPQRKSLVAEAVGSFASLSLTDSKCYKPIFCDLGNPMFHANVPFQFGTHLAPKKLDWASASDSDNTDIEQLSTDAKAELQKSTSENPTGFRGHSSRR